MAGDVRYCNNCRRDIASANYVIHSVHCERNIVLCSRCNEPVPRAELANHEEEFHGRHACELCGQEMERCQMEDHRETCRKRPVSCKFCDFECPFEEADEHQDNCGARTEKCLVCKAYIKLSDQEAHRETCKKEHRAKQLSTCEHCFVQMPTSLLQQHASLCEGRTENSFRSFEPVHSRDNYRHEGKVDCIPCEYCNCNTSIPSDHFVEHISVCGLQYKNCLKCNAPFMLKDRETHSCQSPVKSSGRCDVCQASVPWVDLREHEAACRLAALSSEEEEVKPTFQQKRLLQRDPRPLKKTQETTYQTMRQCPFCRERHPDLILEEHSQNCGRRPVNCELCGRSLLLKDQPQHQERECPMRNRSNYDYRDSENFLAGASGHTKEYEKRVKQCPYCGKKFAEIMFTDHQESCEERPYQCNLCLKPMRMKSKDNHESKECLFKDRFKKVHPESETRTSEDAPMYRKSFEREYLEKNAQVCPYCQNKIPEAKIAEHVQFCAAGKKPCHFCGAEIPKDKENDHLQECIAMKEDSEYQTAGKKKGKKKNKKRNPNNSDQPKGWLETGISTAKTFFSKKSSPVKGEFVPEQYYNAQVVHLPCEFCEAMFPDYLLIEHESGCRPDLVSLPTAPDPKEHISDPFHANLSAKTDPRSTGALPKRNRFHRDSAEGTPGEFLTRQSPPKEKLDFYNYASGIPEHRLISGELKQSKTTLQAQNRIPENKTVSFRMEKSEPAKNSKTELFNFSSSSTNKSTSNQIKSPASTKYPDAQKAEPLKAVGAERAEKKGNISIFRDTPGNFEVETADKYDENLERPNNSRNLGFKSHIKMNPYSSKALQQDLNMPFNESPSVTQHESIETDCDAQLARLLSNPEGSDLTEEDAKNDETFGSHFDPEKPLSLSNNDDNFSDSMEFYDAEDNMKLPNMGKEGILDSYMKLVAKDEGERVSANNNNECSHASTKDKVVNCRCKNNICYCGLLANNNGSDTEYEGQQGRNSINGESSRLSAHRVTNYSHRESCDPNIDNQINAEIEKRSPAFTKWRPQNICNSDSD